MKIKEVCGRTGLTERTIRFYIEKDLIRPSSSEMNGRIYYDFTDRDAENLSQIALLRKIGFPIESILEMEQNPAHIDSVVNSHLSASCEKEKEYSRIVSILKKTEGIHFSDVNDLIGILSTDAADIPLPKTDVEPNFARFDSDTPEEREKGVVDFLIRQRIGERLEKFSRPLKKTAAVAGVLIAALLVIYAISCIPKSISRQYTGVQFRASETGTETAANVSIQGKLYHRLFQNPRFKGLIEIDTVEYTKDCPVELNFYNGLEESGWLTYADFIKVGNDVVPKIHSFAMVRTDGDFRRIAFQLFEPVNENNSELRDLVLCAPALHAEEGMQMLKDLKLADTISQYKK